MWMSHTGRDVPDGVLEFDTLLCVWAEHLWAEGDPKGILNGALCGLAHYALALRGRVGCSWRLYKAWGRCERPKQAPPVPKSVMRALAGWLKQHGHRGAATMIVVAFHHILLSNEFMVIVVPEPGYLLVVLRDTKIGQRPGINQEITIKSKWLRQRFLDAWSATTPGFPLLGMQPQSFRKIWKTALRATGVPTSYTPYSLRRGGATCWFQVTGSFDMVVDQGRWLNAKSCRNYISSALADLGSEELETSLIREIAHHLT